MSTYYTYYGPTVNAGSGIITTNGAIYGLGSTSTIPYGSGGVQYATTIPSYTPTVHHNTNYHNNTTSTKVVSQVETRSEADVTVHITKQEVNCHQCGNKRYIEERVDGTFVCTECDNLSDMVSCETLDYKISNKYELVGSTNKLITCNVHNIWDNIGKVTHNFTKHYIYSRHEVRCLISGLHVRAQFEAKFDAKGQTFDYNSYWDRILCCNRENFIFDLSTTTFYSLDRHILPISIHDLRRSDTNFSSFRYALNSFLGTSSHRYTINTYLECQCREIIINQYKRKLCQTCNERKFIDSYYWKKFPCPSCC